MMAIIDKLVNIFMSNETNWKTKEIINSFDELLAWLETLIRQSALDFIKSIRKLVSFLADTFSAFAPSYIECLSGKERCSFYL